MAIRELINKHSRLFTVISSLFVLACGYMAIASIFGIGQKSEAVIGKMYFSDDDGKTYFVDSANRIYPFDHGGKLAVRAYVFRSEPGGQLFVGYLERISPEGLQLIEGKKPGIKQNLDEVADLVALHMEVKRPGDAAWVKLNTAAGSRVIVPPRSKGQQTPPTMVFP